MNKPQKKKTLYRWKSSILFGTMVITGVFIVLIYFKSPDSFWNFIETETGEFIRSTFKYEKLYDLFIQGIGAWGAVLVGVIALDQSEKSQRLAEKLAARDNSCNILIENYTSLNMIDTGSTLTNECTPKPEETDAYIHLRFKNYSNTFLKSIDIFFGDIRFHSSLTLVNNAEKKFTIKLPKNFDVAKDIKCNIAFTSCNNETTYGDFVIKQGTAQRKSIVHYHFYGMENRNDIVL